MPLDVSLVPPEDVKILRELYRAEMNCQIIHDSWHGRGWVKSYLFRLDDQVIGYGLVGGIRAEPKDIITEFYVLPIHRGLALQLFRQFAAVSGARTVEVQTNDVLLTLMTYDCARQIESAVILFEDAFTSNLVAPGGIFRNVTEADKELIVTQGLDTDAGWMIEDNGRIVAVGGILFHYNVPYGDIYMEVALPFRRRGFGSYLIQELKRTCYEMGRVPAARCNSSNVASRAAMQKAGLLPCARELTAVLPLFEKIVDGLDQ